MTSRSLLARLVGALLFVWGAGLFVGLASITWYGWDYWSLPMDLRETHALHPVLASGAGGGVLLGVVGTALMLAMLLYTVRKKLARVQVLGPLPLWLRFHVICGITGPLFILLHGGLHWPSGLVAVAFWCMVLVALSGVFGRYVYGFLPRMASGRALAWGDALSSLADLRAELVRATAGARTDAIGQAVALAGETGVEARSLFDLVRLDRDVRRRRREINGLLDASGLATVERTAAASVLDEQLRLRRGLEASRVAYRAFRYWHLFHRPLAASMYVIVSIHVLFALVFGGSAVRLIELFGELIVLPYLIVTALIALFFLWPAWRSFRREEAEARELLAAAVDAGRHEPVTIRPWIDPGKCMGSGTCVKVCPEGEVLKVIDGQAHLVNGAACVGHGACVTACPTGAISLRFGSERRGVDIPDVGPDFQSNVGGMFIAGELGGMGLIANAVRQGEQALSTIARRLPRDRSPGLDVLVVGAGPAGIGAGLAAAKAGLSYEVVEQGDIGGSIRHFPRKKVVMTHGLALPGQPKVPASTLTKEELVDLLTQTVSAADLKVSENERVTRVRQVDDDAFDVHTDKRVIRTRRVVLAVGRRGTPRQLGVPGEDLEKVVYRLLDPELIHHSHVLVVGGGDSALEAACALAESPGNRVTLSYRKGTISRAKKKNLEALEALQAAGAIRCAYNTEVKEIAADRVTLSGPDGDEILANDWVYVFAGGVLPTAFLTDAGVSMSRHFGNRVQALEEGDT